MEFLHVGRVRDFQVLNRLQILSCTSESACTGKRPHIHMVRGVPKYLEHWEETEHPRETD